MPESLVAKSRRVYLSSDQQMKVIAVELESPADSYLIEIKGSGTDFDNRILSYTIKSHDGGRRFTYDTIYNDEEFSTLYTERTWWGDTIYFQNPNDYRNKYPLYFDQKATEALDANDLIKSYKSRT